MLKEFLYNFSIQPPFFTGKGASDLDFERLGSLSTFSGTLIFFDSAEPFW
jgi:hypothetical protein